MTYSKLARPLHVRVQSYFQRKKQMDLSVLKYNKQAATGTTPQVQKNDAQSTSDAFLSILSQVRTSKSAEEGSAKVLSRMSEKAETIASVKETDKKRASAETKRNDKAAKETPAKPRYYENTKKADYSNKSANTSKERPSDGQKIPAEENTSHASDRTNGKVQGNTPINIDEGDTLENIETSALENEVISSETDDTGDVGDENALFAAAGVLVNVPADQNRLEIGTKIERIDSESEELAPAENISSKSDSSAAALEKEVAGAENLKASMESAETKTAENQKAEIIPEGVKEKILTDLKTVSTETSAQAEALKKTQTSTSAANENVAQAQAEDLASVLPEGTKAQVQVTTNIQEKVEENLKPTADSDSSEEVVVALKPVEMNKPAEKAADFSTETKAVSSANAEEGNSRNPDMNNQNQSGNTTNPAIAAQPQSTSEQAAATSFKSSLSSVESTSASAKTTSPTGTETDIAMLGTTEQGVLKGKAVSGAVPQQRPVSTHELVDQIKVDITKAAKEGLEKININLKPKELGNIQISLEVDKDGNMKASIIASRPETLEMLQKDASALRQAMNEAGLKADDNAFNFSYRGDQNAPQENREFAGNGRSQPENTVNGVETAQEESIDDLTEALIASSWTSGRHALNIRV